VLGASPPIPVPGPDVVVVVAAVVAPAVNVPVPDETPMERRRPGPILDLRREESCGMTDGNERGPMCWCVLSVGMDGWMDGWMDA